MTEETQADTAFGVLTYVETVLDSLAILSNLYFLVLLRRPFFHLNLRIMLGSFSLALLAMMISRILLVYLPNIFRFNQYQNANTVLLIVGSILFATITIVMSATIWMAIERLLATIFAKTYEKNRLYGAVVTALFCAAVWIGNLAFCWVIITRSVCKNGVLKELNALKLDVAKSGIVISVKDTIAVLKKMKPEIFSCLSDREFHDNSDLVSISIVILVSNFVGLLMFIVIRQYNKKRWKLDLQKNLSYRYQTMENLRTSKQLLKVLVADFLIASYYFAYFHYAFNITHISVFFGILSLFFNWVNAVASLVFPLLFIVTHQKMMAKFKQDFQCRKQRKIKSTAGIPVRRRATEEEAHKESNVYFTQLKNSWN
ncbi:hypothetical protein L596_013983 [Steinernema carpocapsae]|uniref:G-protein coupled receptors family 1 profile domain-containing protein n=1 Tax=Steinernema carpocapsae TaxID=34508 RepID=A0A4U5NA01_STECR|nr:hypothetical protein L596_013983 [Steinernema carpocapsae]